MPQETNLNISPYFDDFDANKNYHKVLFKPGYPIQARELTSLQSILQNQVEQQGKHLFKDGTVVIPGQVRIDNPIYAVEIENVYNGVPIALYFDRLIGKKLRGSISGVFAEIVYLLKENESERQNFTLYVKYLQNGGVNFENSIFFDGETLILDSDLTYGELGFTVPSGQGICNTISSNSNSLGSSAIVTSGVYFVRGYFVNVSNQRILLDQYNSTPSYKIGFDVVESIVSADDDDSLFDNAKGFSNYTSPGADRLKIELILSKKELSDNNTDNFIEILRIENGNLIFKKETTQYSLIRDELARRTYEESGDYYIKPFEVFVRDTLNDRVRTDGLYYSDQLTSDGNSPSDDLMVYKIGPGKAYVNGYDIEKISTTEVTVEKTRSTRTIENEVINYDAGTSLTLNRGYGTPIVGLATTAYISLMDSRIGVSSHVSVGTTIGVARVYDFIPESDYVDNKSNLNLRIFDVQTFTRIGLTTNISSLTTPTIIRGKKSKASGYLRENITNSRLLTLYNVSGSFLKNEQIIINEIDDGRLINEVIDYNISDVKSVYSRSGITTFNADVVLSKKSLLAPSGTEFTITESSSGISTVSAGLEFTFTNKIKPGDIVSYASTILSGDIIYNKVESVSDDGLSFSVSGITTVISICDGKIPSNKLNVSNVVKITNMVDVSNSSLMSRLRFDNISNISLETQEILQRRQFSNVSFSSNYIQLTITESDLYFAAFDEDRFIINYSDGSIEPMRFDKYDLDTTGKILTFYGLTRESGTANIITTVKNTKPSFKNKRLNKTSTIVVNKSQIISSGIGTTTLNDGLNYSNVYGVRVQDNEICLNVPDVLRVLAVYESADTSDPQLPRIQLTAFTGSTNSNQDFVIGEQITGQTSGAVALIVGRVFSDSLEYIYLNTNQFSIEELVTGDQSNVNATIITKTVTTSKDISQNFYLDDGQRPTHYDYARLVRKENTSSPSRKLKVVFQNYIIDSGDTGEFISINSYPSEGFKYDIPLYGNARSSDYIDTRPRVSSFTLNSNSKSPFEFESRNFDGQGQYAKYTLCPNENIILSYSYYLPRVDVLYLTSSGSFEIAKGIPNEVPSPPNTPSNSFEIATITIPPYLYNIKNVKVNLSQHKRYRMEDISLLEDRIDRIEKYTTLSLLESKTENYSIKDAVTGLDRFKCGFFVDDFSSHLYHNLENPLFRSCIDTTTNSLRPLHYTTSLDLQLGSEAISGFIDTFSSTADQSYPNSIGSEQVKKTGELITLNYSEVLYDSQTSASTTENVVPYLVGYWEGSIELRPSFDNWIEEKTIRNEQTIINDPITIQNNNDDIPISSLPPSPNSGIPPFDWIANANELFTTNAIWRRGRRGRLLRGRNWFNFRRRGRHLLIGSRFDRGSIELISRDLIDRRVSNGLVNGTTIHLEWMPRGNNRNIFRSRGGISYESFVRQILPPDIADDYIRRILSAPTGRGSRNQIISVDYTPTTSVTPPAAIRPIEISDDDLPTNFEDDIDESTSYNIQNIEYLRSRNIEFDIKVLKSRTRFVPFFGNIDVSNYIIPKLLEIRMVSGSFQTGETVESDPHFTGAKIKFRLCNPNHKIGAYNSPLEIYTLNPYTQTPFETNYSQSSTVLNVDTRSLQLPTEVDFYGSISNGMKIIGKSSGAVATISNIRLVSDNNGRLIGSLFIPDHTVPGNPKWLNGENTFKVVGSTVSNNNINNITSLTENTDSSAEIEFVSSGESNITEINIVTTRTPIIRIPPPPIPAPAPAPVVAPAPVPGPVEPPRRRRRRPLVKDPLAQSFFVEDETGVFLTGVNIFFETKDSDAPVILQLRTMIAGVPSNVIIPFSEVILEPSAVNVSADGSIETKFTFPSPVYLSGPQQQTVRFEDSEKNQSSEYAIVLLSDSPNYRVFISRLGELDISTGTRISTQPTLGSLFKSQNGTTWNPSQLEDLKYDIFRASFQNEGIVRFFNPKLSIGNNKSTVTSTNSFVPLSKKIIVGLGSTGFNTTDVVPGVTLSQGSATGTLIGIAGSASSAIVSNSGIGYSVGTYTNISLETETGYGQGIIATLGVTDSGISTVTITSGGLGYQVGDSIIVPRLQNLGYDGKVTITSIGSSNTFIIDEIQGTFNSGITTLNYINSSGITTQTGIGVTISSIIEDQFNDGLHMKVIHQNHGMHSTENYVKIEQFRPTSDVANSIITTELSSTDTTISVQSGIGFTQFEGIDVSTLNPGYVIIGDEVIGYTSVSGNTLISSSILRGIDGTQVQSYTINSPVFKYEFNGISIRRINKVHNFAEVDINNHPIDLNSYYIKIDTGSTDFDGNVIGLDRSDDLYFKRQIQSGRSGTVLSNNIQYEILAPKVNSITPAGTEMTSRIRTFTGTSVSGNERSFVDAGYQDLPLNGRLYFQSPRIICSDINEQKFITESQQRKSFSMDILMNSTDERVSPVIDVVPPPSLILTSNLINAPIDLKIVSEYANSDSVRGTNNDPHAAIYVSKPINLAIPANSLNVILSANKNETNDIRVLYQIFRVDKNFDEDSYELFPGYSNYRLNGIGKTIINASLSDGSSDFFTEEVNNGQFKEYTYTADNLPEFTSFAIKIVMAGTNQASPPLISQLRAIATTLPSL
jgi:hypothetical protein